MKKLTTERLVIKGLPKGQAGLVVQYLLANREHNQKWTPLRDPGFYTEEFQGQMLQVEDPAVKRFYIFDKGDLTQVVGDISFTQIVYGPFRSCYLGYGMLHRRQNEGLMTEALAAAVEYMFREIGLHRIQANVMPANAASIRVLEKLGFKKEGLHESYLKINGRWEDHFSYARLND